MRFKFGKIFHTIEKYIFSDRILKNVLLVSGGTVLGQLINILSQPIITRLYPPEHYGILTIFSSILLIFRVSSLSYQEAIPIAKNDEEAYNLIGISLSLVIFISTIFVTLYIVNGEYILNILNIEVMEKYWFLIPIGVLIQGIFLILIQWMYRKRRFKFVSGKNIIQSISGNGTKTVLGLLNFNSLGLIIGRIMTVGGAVVPLSRAFIRENKYFFQKISFNSIYSVAKKYINFPLYQTPSMLSTHLRNQLPIIMLAPLFGSQVVGYFGLTDQIIRLPMTLIGKPVMNVFYSEVASLGPNKPEEIKQLSKKLFKQLFFLGVVPLVIIVIFGPFLFSFVFGNSWAESGIYARILMFYVFADFIFTPVSKIYEVFGKQKVKMVIDVSGLFILIIVFLLGGYFGVHEYVLLIIFSFTMSIIFLTIYIMSIKILNNAIKEKENYL